MVIVRENPNLKWMRTGGTPMTKRKPPYWEHIWLVVWNMIFICPFSWECHHPNWRTPSFFRGIETTHQWIGLRKHLQEIFVYHWKIQDFRCRFSLKPIHWTKQIGWIDGSGISPWDDSKCSWHDVAPWEIPLLEKIDFPTRQLLEIIGNPPMNQT